MKRTVLFLLGVLICFSTSEAISMNILQNPSFEDGLDPPDDSIPLHWQITADKVERTNEIPGHTGDYTLKVGLDATPFVLGQQLRDIPDAGGKTFVASVWGKYIDPNYNNTAIMKMEFYSGAGPFLASQEVIWNPSAIDTWTQQELTAVAPAGTGKVQLQLLSIGAGFGGTGIVGAVFHDDVSLSIVPEPGALLLSGFGFLGCAFRRHRNRIAG